MSRSVSSSRAIWSGSSNSPGRLGFAAPLMTELAESRAKSAKERKAAEAAELRKKLKDGARVIALDEARPVAEQRRIRGAARRLARRRRAPSPHRHRRPGRVGRRIGARRRAHPVAWAHDASAWARPRRAGRTALSRGLDPGRPSLSPGLKANIRAENGDNHETLTGPPSTCRVCTPDCAPNSGIDDNIGARRSLTSRIIADWR